jgi:hypothetical protein
MLRLRKFRSALLLISIIELAYMSAADAAAGIGRNVLGTYELQNVVNSGDQVSATFIMNAHNNSNVDISYSTFKLENITLGDAMQPGMVFLTSLPLSISKQGSAMFQGNITIPVQEYNLWRQGAMPRVIMQYTDTRGDTRNQAVELLPEDDSANQYTNEMVNAMIQSIAPSPEGGQ